MFNNQIKQVKNIENTKADKGNLSIKLNNYILDSEYLWVHIDENKSMGSRINEYRGTSTSKNL